MNTGIAILGLILAGGLLLGLFTAAAGNANTYVDTFGNTLSPAENQSQQAVQGATEPIFSLGTGAVVFISVLVLFAAGYGIYRVATGGRYQGSRG
jgi:hypothetical protein